jgi:site-specific DNA recombinase
MTRAGLYVRISSDPLGEGLGVARQEQDCRELAERLGWTVAEVFRDNDQSAFSGKVRPAYVAMLDAIRAGRIDGVLAWHPDRLHRSPRELEDFVDALEATGCQVSTVQAGQIDLATPAGRLNARVIGSFSRYESEHKSARVRRKMQQNAEAGKRHGPRGFGWEADGTLCEAEAAWVRQVADWLLAGVSLWAAAKRLNAAGVVTVHGKPWSPHGVRTLAIRASSAGLREYHGEVICQGQWTPIYDVDTYRKLRALLTDPARRLSPAAGAARHLLSTGGAVCGLQLADGTTCGLKMRAAGGKKHKGIARPIYRCASGGHVSRDLAALDAFTTELVLTRLRRDDAADLLHRGEPASVTHARAEAEKLRSRLELAAVDYANGDVTNEQLRVITARLLPQIAALEKQIPAAVGTAVPLKRLVESDDVAATWEALDVAQRRQVIAALLTIVVKPATRRASGLDPASVTVEWRA